MLSTLEKSVLRSEAFDGPRRTACLPPFHDPASTSLILKCYQSFAPQLPGDKSQPLLCFPHYLLQAFHEFSKPDPRFWWKEGVPWGGVTSGAQDFRPLPAPTSSRSHKQNPPFVSLGVSASDPKDLGFYLARYFSQQRQLYLPKRNSAE